ncbi:DUF5659 domain-containing protein [Gracilibacillus sp. HCP3S3_G5_1]|uniref:DUF5659 domain-containing protein n=1 Tax=unclassified Gracilibacillus TaxID=2625209 RepID=UPI003F88DA29
MKVVKSMKLAGWLMQRGFVLLKTDKANDGSGRNVFLFKESNEITEAIQLYKITK